MKCWAIKKVLAIYVGKDIPFFNKTIEKHLKTCSACSKVYRQFKHKKHILRDMKTPKISPDLLENFCEEILEKINLETNIPHKFEFSNRLTRYKFMLMPISILIFLILGLWIYYQQESNSYKSDLSPTVKIINNQNKEKLQSSDKNYLNEYKLDQVQPYKLRDASF